MLCFSGRLAKRGTREKRLDLEVSRVLKMAGTGVIEMFSGSTALDFPIHSTVKTGRIITRGRLCLLPLLGRLALCSPPVGRDESAVDHDKTKGPGHKK